MVFIGIDVYFVLYRFILTCLCTSFPYVPIMTPDRVLLKWINNEFLLKYFAWSVFFLFRDVLWCDVMLCSFDPFLYESILLNPFTPHLHSEISLTSCFYLHGKPASCISSSSGERFKRNTNYSSNFPVWAFTYGGKVKLGMTETDESHCCFNCRWS